MLQRSLKMVNKDGSDDMGLDEWYVWTVRPGAFDVVKKYIESKVPEVKSILCPTVTTEKKLKSGNSRKKSSHLYAGYIFLQYVHDTSNPVAWQKLNNHPFITQYVGPCTAKDLASVHSLQKVDKPEDSKVKDFKVGDSVEVNGGVFKGLKGKVTEVKSNAVKVGLNSEGNHRSVVLSPDDLKLTKN